MVEWLGVICFINAVQFTRNTIKPNVSTAFIVYKLVTVMFLFVVGLWGFILEIKE